MNSQITGTLKYIKHDYKDKAVILETESGEKVKMRLIRFLNILTKFRDSRISDGDLGKWCWETKGGGGYKKKELYIYLKTDKDENSTIDIWFSSDPNKQVRWANKNKLTVPKKITANITLTDFSRYGSSCYACVRLQDCSFTELNGREVFMDLTTLLGAEKGNTKFRFVKKGGAHVVLVSQ